MEHFFQISLSSVFFSSKHSFFSFFSMNWQSFLDSYFHVKLKFFHFFKDFSPSFYQICVEEACVLNTCAYRGVARGQSKYMEESQIERILTCFIVTYTPLQMFDWPWLHLCAYNEFMKESICLWSICYVVIILKEKN